MDAIEKKREKEMQMVEEMIRLYCRKKHGQSELCMACNSLLEYAKMRSMHCPFMATKTFCSRCKVHCYKPEMREKIKEVMRFSGPRMLFHHPIKTLQHLFEERREKRQ